MLISAKSNDFLFNINTSLHSNSGCKDIFVIECKAHDRINEATLMK